MVIQHGYHTKKHNRNVKIKCKYTICFININWNLKVTNNSTHLIHQPSLPHETNSAKYKINPESITEEPDYQLIDTSSVKIAL